MKDEYGVLEIETDNNGEFSEKTSKFISQKIQEAIDENIWYTQDEVIEELEKTEEKNSRCIKSFILKEQEQR